MSRCSLLKLNNSTRHVWIFHRPVRPGRHRPVSVLRAMDWLLRIALPSPATPPVYAAFLKSQAPWALDRCHRFMIAVFLLCSAQAASAEDWKDTAQIHGFLSQGYVNTSDNRWYGDSEEGSWDLREIGLNASIRPVPYLQLSGQFLSRTAGRMGNGEIGVDYALLDWTALSNADKRVGARLGRIKNPLGFFNETRDVAFTRPGIFLPQSVYFDRVRDLMLSSDGMHLYADWRLDDAELMLQLGVGKPLVDVNVEATFLGREFQGDLSSLGPVWMGKLAYERDGGRLRFALSGVIGSLDFQRGPDDPPPPFLESGDIDFELLIASFQYNEEVWSLTAEFLTQEVVWNDMGTIYPSRNPGQGYYLQFDLRPIPQWEFFLRYGERIPNTNDRDGSKTEMATGAPAHTQFAKEWVLGARWDPTDSLMVRAEYHHVDGAAWLSNREIARKDTERFWNMLAILVSYRF